MTDTNSVWKALTTYTEELGVLDGVRSVLTWDQQTQMPPQGAQWRGQQAALMSRLIHERATAPQIGEWLDALEARDDLDAVQRAGVRNLRRGYDRATKVPSALVERMGALQSEGFTKWIQAKDSQDFSVFAPVLAESLELMRERAQAIDSDGHPWEVTLQEFDPGTTVADLKALFGRLQPGLTELIEAVRDNPLPRVEAPFALAGQRTLFRQVATQLGYALDAGRIDEAEHPFTISMGPGDVRITTHLYETDLLAGLGGTVHEVGHALYEQGLPRLKWPGSGVDAAASFGLHESQSRFWENFIGRSLPFFRWFEGQLRQHFPDTAVRADDLYRGANRVVPGLIRISADEVTYNLHIIVRFEIELALFEGRLAVADLPAAWNDKYRQYLGITPPNDAVGVLQDVHWSGMAFAYFPSYTLGNLYAASFGQALLTEVPDLWDRVERGDFAPVLSWLRANIHEKGHLADTPELVRAVVGERDHVEDLLSYLWGRHGALHGVSRPA